MLQVLIVSFGGSVFSTVPLSLVDWVKSISLGAMVLVGSAIIRAIWRRTLIGGVFVRA